MFNIGKYVSKNFIHCFGGCLWDFGEILAQRSYKQKSIDWLSARDLNNQHYGVSCFWSALGDN